MKIEDLEPDKVRRMAKLGLSDEDIAVWFDIGIISLKKHFRRELLLGRCQQKAKLLSLQWGSAGKGTKGILAQMWLGKNLISQSDHSPGDHPKVKADDKPREVLKFKVKDGT